MTDDEPIEMNDGVPTDMKNAAPTQMKEAEPIDVLRNYPPHGDTLYGLLMSRAEVRPDEPFLLCNGTTLSWARFRDRTHSACIRMARDGICAGDRVAIMADNSVDYVVVLFATIISGAIAVPMNPGLTLAEATYILDQSKPKLIVSPDALAALVESATRGKSVRPRRWSLDEGLDHPGAEHATERADFRMTRPACQWPPTQARSAVAAAADTAVIIYTSGTTGSPKGVMHSQRNMIWAGEYSVGRLHLQPHDRLLCVLPFFHINGLFYSLMAAAAAGASLVMAPRFSASGFWRLAAESGATEVNIIATVGRILMRRPVSEFVPEHRIRKLYGAPIPPDVYVALRERFGIPSLIEGYGLTEAPALCSNPYRGPRKVGSIGVPTLHPDPGKGHAELRVIDDEGRDVTDGSAGELIVRSPIVMQGYYKNPAATQAAFVDGWFRTGDLVRKDADGYYTFVARKKDIIRRRGENISGAEIDDAVSAYPGVQVAAAIAVDAELGEDDILVAVVRKPGATVSEAELHHWCQDRLNPIKVPKYIVFVDSIPCTPSHRVAKHLLKKDQDLLHRAVKFPDG